MEHLRQVIIDRPTHTRYDEHWHNLDGTILHTHTNDSSVYFHGILVPLRINREGNMEYGWEYLNYDIDGSKTPSWTFRKVTLNENQYRLHNAETCASCLGIIFPRTGALAETTKGRCAGSITVNMEADHEYRQVFIVVQLEYELEQSCCKGHYTVSGGNKVTPENPGHCLGIA